MKKIAQANRWTGWFARKPSLIRPFPVLRCEELEDRRTPTTFTWTGLGGNSNWSNGANWAGGVAPLGVLSEVDKLSFPQLPGQNSILSTNNDIAAGVFDTITFSTTSPNAGYTLTGNALTLTSNVVVNAASVNNTLAMPVTLGGSSASTQSVTVNAGGSLVISGQLKDPQGATLTKDGPGTLTLSADNTGFAGPIKVNNSSGTLVVANANALGGTSSPGTTVGTGSTLSLLGNIGTVATPLRLNGLGVSNSGALFNQGGTNTWSGNVILDSDSAVGGGGVLKVTGVISDSGAGHNLFKEGTGEVQLNSPTGNTYRGQTTVNNGTLTAGTGSALGVSSNPADPANGVIVNSTLTGRGQLRLQPVSGTGFAVVNKYLTLNNSGLAGDGALYNFSGTNTWAGPVILGSPIPNGSRPTIGVAPSTSLIVSGVVSTPNSLFGFVKSGLGELVLNNANTYSGGTTVQQGVLDVRDSNALGVDYVVVENGATLQLDVEAGLAPTDPGYGTLTDAQGRNLSDDSATHDANKLRIGNLLYINGRGVSGAGALYSNTGINVWTANVNLDTLDFDQQDAIGVALDPRNGHPTADSNYLTADYSLTVSGVISGPQGTDFIKTGTGNLILPVDNAYQGVTRVEEGWVTVQSNDSLGSWVQGLGATAQPGTVVSNGAAVHIVPLAATSPPLNIDENITLAGSGPTLPYAFISQKGALMNLGGDNVWSGDIGLIGTGGIGVEQINSGAPIASQLTVTGSITDGKTSYSFRADGGQDEQAFLIDTLGATSGTITISYDMLTIPDRLTVYYPPRGPGQVRLLDTGMVSGQKSVSIPFGPGTATNVEVVMNEGGNPDSATAWYLDDVTVTTGNGSLAKYGSRRLRLQGAGTYTGSTDIREGTVQAQNNTALGLSTGGTATSQETYNTTKTTVEPGAVLELGQTVASLNGGIQEAVQVTGEQLVLNGPAQQIAVAGATNPAPSAFTLTLNGQTTGLIPVGASAADVQAALNALFSVAHPEVQNVQVIGSSGTFTLTFNGQTTGLLPFNATAAQVRAALIALPSVGGVGGTVAVTAAPVTGGIKFTVTFGGTLGKANVASLVAAGGGGTAATVTVQQEGLGGYVTVTEVPAAGATEYHIAFGGDLANQNVSDLGAGMPTASVVTTQQGGPAQAEIQAASVFLTYGTFTLTFNGQSTAPLQPNATAQDVQSALNALSSIGGVSGNVTVTATPVVGGTQYAITFGGALANTNVPQLTVNANGSNLPGVVSLQDGGPTQSEIQAVRVTPSDATFKLSYGAQSTVAIPITATALQVQNAINSALTAFVGDNGGTPVTVVRTGNVFTVYLSSRASEVALLTATPQPSASMPEITVSGVSKVDGGSSNASLVTLTPVIRAVQVTGTSGTFTLTFDGYTATLPYNATAVDVRNALNALPSVGGVYGYVEVVQVGTTFTITFDGSLADTTHPLTAGGGASLVTAPSAFDYAWRGPMTLSDSSRIAIAGNTRLSSFGPIGDAQNAIAVVRTQAGAAAKPEVQTVQVPSARGSYHLSFRGQQTAAIPYDATAAQVQAALGALSSIGGVGGSVYVYATAVAGGTLYTVTFGGSLANTSLPLLQVLGDGSDLVKRGQGELLLAGSNTYSGTTYIDSGIVTAMNSQAFGATTNGTVVANNAQLQLQGSLTIAGEELDVQGTGVSSPSQLSNTWFNVGPAPTNNGQSPQNLPTSGRIVGVAADPTDPNVIYIATAGGGAWKTKDQGRTWQPLFDSTADANATMWGGAITVAPSDPRVVYFATGDSYGLVNGSPLSQPYDNFAGSGVYRSTDSGATWTLLTNADGSNPMSGLAVTKLVVDPGDASRIYVASSNINVLQQSTTAIPGVYRYDVAGWYNLTGATAISPSRSNPGGYLNPTGVAGQAPYNKPDIQNGKNNGGIGAPNTIGPDDDYRITFPVSGSKGVPSFAWSDIALINGVLYASLYMPYNMPAANAATPQNLPPGWSGTSGYGQQFFEWDGKAGTTPSQQAILNGVYRTTNPAANNPSWYIGDANAGATNPAADSRKNEFPVGPVADPANGTQAGRNGLIKLSGLEDPSRLDPSLTPYRVVYASVLQPDWNTARKGELLDIQKTTQNGANGWSATGSTPAAPFGTNTPTSTALGLYANAIVVQAYDPYDITYNDPNVVYVAGQNNIYRTTDGGATWTAITPDAAGRAPASYFHTLSLDSNNQLLSGSDGGIWMWNGSYYDLNGNLSIAQLNSADPYPTDPNQAIVGSQNNGVQQYNGSPAWQGSGTTLPGANAGAVQYNSQNPLIAYANVQGALYKTQDGGQTWTKIRSVTDLSSGTSQPVTQFPIVVDPVNPSRVLIGGTYTDFGAGALYQSTDDGQNFTNLQAGIRVTAIGAATYQGPFVADPNFPLVTDQLSNTYDPNTIYVTDGTTIRVTKNDGVSWATRSIGVKQTTYAITFAGSLSYKNVSQLVATSSGGAHASVSTALDGSLPSADEVQIVQVTGNSGTFTLSFTNPDGVTATTAPLPYNASAAMVVSALNNLLSISNYTKNAVQTVDVVGNGAFRLSYNGAQTAIIPAGSTASFVESQLNALATIVGAGGGVHVSPSATGYVVTFDVGSFANSNVSTLQLVPVYVETSINTLGPPTVDYIDNYMQGGTFTLSFKASTGASATTGALPYNATAAQIQAALNGLSSIGQQFNSSVQVTPVPISGGTRFIVTFQGAGPNGFGVVPQPNPITAAPGADGTGAFVAIGVTQVGGAGSVSAPAETSGLAGTISSLTVDPSNRDTVYATYTFSNGQSGPEVFRSTDAGRTWTDITGQLSSGDSPLPTGSAYTAALDPRTNTLYIGNNYGVWQLPNASAAGPGSIAWSPAGGGMANVKVTSLTLNQTLNTLTAATYGRGMYQLFLTDYAGNTGAALRVISGSSVWTGPVVLAGNTTVATNGTQQIQNGIAAASLNVIGSVSDGTAGNNSTLTKVGLGTMVLSGTNNYGGQTQIQEGIVKVNNPSALGLSTGNTDVANGAALELESDLQLEPVVIHGGGIPFNGHNTGALRNLSNDNTYTGTLTLGSDNATIGVDTGTTLTVGAKPGLQGTGSITDGANTYSFEKELTGTLVLASSNSYGGVTTVNQGALQVQDGNALSGTLTRVRDGAQVQIARNAITLAPTVANEPLLLSGTGINDTGALLNVRGDTNPTGSNDNTWAGPITFDMLPNFSPVTNPGSQIAIGVADSGVPGIVDTLTIASAIQNSALASFGLIKTGPGRLTLAAANGYTGVTNVDAGSVRVQDSHALGAAAAASAVQTIAVVGAGGNFGLSFNGAATGSLFTAAIATASEAGTTVTITTVAPNRFQVGQSVVISGVGTGYDGTFTITGVTPTGFTYTSTATGLTNSSGGTATVRMAPPDEGAAAANAAMLQAALGALSTIGNGNVKVSGTQSSNGEVYTVTFQGALAGVPLPLLVTQNVSAGLGVTIATAQQGGAGVVVAAGASLELDGSNLTIDKVLTVNGDGVVGTANVAAAPVANGTVYTVSLGGALGNTVTPLLTAAGSGGATAAVTTPEVQTVQVTGTDGTFTLTFNGQTTAALPFDATAAQVQAALNALSNIGGVGGSVAVTSAGDPRASGGATYTVAFGGTLGSTDQPQVTANSVVAYVTTVADGAVTGAEVQNVSVTGTGGTYTLSFQGQTTAQIPYGATAADVEAALTALSTVGGTGGTVDVTLAGSVYTITFGGALANASLPQITVGSSSVATGTVQNGGGSGTGVQVVTATGASGTFTLSFQGQTTAPLPYNATAAQVAAALEALTGIGGRTGALNNVSGTNTYAGVVTLGAQPNPNLPSGLPGVSLGAAPATTLTVNKVQDPTSLAVPAPQLQKVGQGTIVFSGANPYGGKTSVVDGVLQIRDHLSLGAPRAEVQVISVYGTFGTVTLNLGGANGTNRSAALSPVPATALSNFTTALNDLINNSGYAANLTVASIVQTQVPGGFAYEVTFGGALAATNLPQITATGSGGAAADDYTQADGNGAETQQVQVVATNTSGQFALTFNGKTTPFLQVTATAAQVQAALNNLSSIGGVGGSVIVTQTGLYNGPGGATYTVTFGGTLANANLPQMISSTQLGATATVSTLNDGPEATVVQAGATLQIGTSMNMDAEGVTINGQGFQSQGALSVNGGGSGATVNWYTNTPLGSARPLVLGSNASIGTANANDSLTFLLNPAAVPPVPPAPPISDNGFGYSLDLYGRGTTAFQATGDNGYTGTTTVHDGTLLLNQSGGTAAGGAIMGNLVVGDPSGTTTPVVRSMQGNQIANPASVSVTAGGTLDLNGFTETIGNLTVTGGSVFTDQAGVAGGQLTTGNVTMNGGTINVHAGGSLSSGSVTMAAGAQIVLGNTSSLTASTISMDGSSIAASGAAAGQTVNVTTGVTLANASSIALGNASTLTTGPLTASGTSSISLGNTAVWTAGAVSLDDSSISVGTNLTGTTSGIEMANNSGITVGANGSLTTGNVTASSSQITLGGGTTATTQDVSLTGSSISIGSLGSVILNGDVTAASTSTAGSAINGPGSLDLNGSDLTVTVGHAAGSVTVDLLISAILKATGLEKIVKAGLGLVELNTPAATPFPNLIDVQAGDVQVDTTAGPVKLDGGSLSGSGAVGQIDGSGNPSGTVSPGVAHAANPAGILTSGTVASPVADVWGASTTYSVYLANPSNTHPAPVAGADHSQLYVNGTLDITGATLTGVVGPGIQTGDRFVVIKTTGGVIGRFAGSGALFIQGQQFTIDYSNPNEVALNKVLASVSITSLTSSSNPSDVNQGVTFTATVTPDNPLAGPIPTGDTVTFTLDGVPQPPVTAVSNGVYTLTVSNLTAGAHTLTAQFNGDSSNFSASSVVALTPVQTVVVPSIGSLTGAATNVSPLGNSGYISPTSSPNVQDTVSLSATVNNEVGATGWTITVKDGGNNTVAVLTGTGGGTGTSFTINAAWDGTYTAPYGTAGSPVPNGAYTLTASFLDPWGNGGTSTPFSVVVDNTSPAASSVASSNPVIAPALASSVPTSTALTGTVSDTNLSGWTLTIRNSNNAVVRTLSGTGPTVNATWDGKDAGGSVVADGAYTVTLTATDLAGNSTTSAATSVYVFTSPTIALGSNTPVTYGQAVTFTATVSVPAQIAGFLNGTPVQIFSGGQLLGSGTLSLAGGQYQATIVVPKLNAGTYTNITAVYPGTPNIPPGASAPYTQVVQKASITVQANNQTAQYGSSAPTLTYSVGGLVAGDSVGQVFSGALATNAAQAVGTYSITQGSLTPNGNYTITTFVPATLTVTPAQLTIVVDNATRVVNTPNPTFTATYQGLALGDSSGVVSGLNLVTAATVGSAVGQYAIVSSGTPSAQNYTITVVPGVLSVVPVPTDFAVGSGAGSPGQARLYSPDGQVAAGFDLANTPFGTTSGIRVTAADMNHDGVPDIVVGTGPGVDAEVRVIDGATGGVLFDVKPFDDPSTGAIFTSGVFVATGDMNGDGFPELVVTPDQGGGPRALIYNGRDFSPLVSFFGINDPDFRGGCRPALGDINGDGRADLVIAAGYGGGPRISVWDGSALASLQFVNVMPDFFAFPDVLRNGTYVAVGDVNGDGFGDIVVGAGPGGGPAVEVLSGLDLLHRGTGYAVNSPVAKFFAGDPNNRGGVRVAAKTLSGSIFTDVVTGGGDGALPTVTAYRGSSLASGNVDPLFALDTFPGLHNGVYVG